MAEETQQEEEAEKEQESAKLGLTSGKYARSQAEAEEKAKAKAVRKAKQKLDMYQQREQAVVMTLSNLFGGSVEERGKEENENKQEEKGEQMRGGAAASSKQTVRVTRNDMDAGTRVLRIVDTHGCSTQDSTLVLTQDLCHLESKLATNTTTPSLAPKSYPDDAENNIEETKANDEQKQSVYGVIKVFLQNISNCTVLVKCKLISGTLEMHHCSNVVVKIQGPHATVATVQMDLSENILLEFHDAPSGKNKGYVPSTAEPSLHWGQDKDDRIFHAGVKNLTVKLYRDGMLDMETTADYLRDGAVAVGNATPEEMQFVTSVQSKKNDDAEETAWALVTESVVRTGSTTGQQVRAMTERELQIEKEKREKAAKMALAKAEDMIQIKDKDGKPIVTHRSDDDDKDNKETNVDVEEVLSPQIQAIVDECQQNKVRGNEAFTAGEYGQAILLYSLALDKAEELPDAMSASFSSTSSTTTTTTFLFPRDVVYANRAACFLKLGQPEKAEQDASKALQWNPQNIKALFRQGLALHAQQQYERALPYLVQALKLEPSNKQIKQALQFCEVRLEQELRKRHQQ